MSTTTRQLINNQVSIPVFISQNFTNNLLVKGVDIALWSGLEINVAIICASVPALKPLFVKTFPHLISSFADSSKRSKPSRSTHGTLPLHSFDRRHHEAIDSEDKNLGIQVRQSFEMKAVAADRDDSSDKNLVAGPEHRTNWTTAYSENRARRSS